MNLWNRITSSALIIEAPPAFALNKLREKEVELFDLEVGENTLRVTIKNAWLKVAKNTLNSVGITYKTTHADAREMIKKAVLSRLGLLLGILLAIAIIAIYSQMLITVKITGNERVSEGEISKMLLANGIIFPTFSNRVDVKRVEEIIENHHEITDASVYTQGTTLCIDILERLPKVEVEASENPSAVISGYSGIVKSIVVSCGTSAVSVGDSVGVGDVLIYPYRVTSEGENKPCNASGIITMEVTLQKEILITEYQIQKVRTGREEVITALEIPFVKSQIKSSFAMYECTAEARNISAIIPLKIVTVRAFELTEEQVKIDSEDAIAMALRIGFEELEKSALEIGKPLEKGFFTKPLDKNTELSIYYRTEVKIETP